MDTLQDADVEYGEVLVYEVSRDSLRDDPSTECHTATLRFTDFTGNNCILTWLYLNIIMLCRKSGVGSKSC